MISPRFRPLLNSLLIELVECWQRKSPELLRVESAFMLTMKYWGTVKNECWKNAFQSPEEEIDFFKNVKCHFTGRLAYYTILYEALVAAPESGELITAFWQAELKRYDRFVERTKAFIKYLESGLVKNDEEYFLRKNMVEPAGVYVKIYDGDAELCSAKDHLVSACFAENAYKLYVLGRLHS